MNLTDTGATVPRGERAAQASSPLPFPKSARAPPGGAIVSGPPYILAQQRKHKAIIQQRLAQIPGLAFRRQCDDAGDSATFFHMLFPSEAAARKAHQAMGAAGVGGAYWYDNMYHYIKQWDHLKDLRMPFRTVAHELGLPQDLKTLRFPQSDDVISRLISFNIRVTWTEAELTAYLDKMESAVRSALA